MKTPSPIAGVDPLPYIADTVEAIRHVRDGTPTGVLDWRNHELTPLELAQRYAGQILDAVAILEEEAINERK